MQRQFHPLALALALALPGCAARGKAMCGFPTTGSVHALNAMSVPVCKVTVYSTLDPEAAYDNQGNGRVLLEPGAEGTLSYPIAKDDTGVPRNDATYGMRIFGCVKEASSMNPAGQLADIRSVDVHQQVVLRRRGSLSAVRAPHRYRP